jgi:hypothetical protein
MSVLILASPKDAHVKVVRQHLAALGVSTYQTCPSRLLKGAGFKLKLGDSAPKFRFEAPDELSDCSISATEVDLESVTATWLRGYGRLNLNQIAEPWAARLMENESSRALSGLFRLVAGLWVNHPAAQAEASLKLSQLEIARRIGFEIPVTLVTNDRAAVADFYHSCDRQMIYKLIDESSWDYFPDFEVPKGLPTLPFRESDLAHLEQVTLGLHLFQRRIDKVADIRVTVIGQKVFAVRIESQEGKGRVDFRLDYSVAMAPCVLPDDIAGNCLQLLRKLGLNYGAIDLCLDRDGRHIFLEINAQGQWLWMEKGLSLPMSLHYARLLAGLDPPVVPPDYSPREPEQ